MIQVFKIIERKIQRFNLVLLRKLKFVSPKIYVSFLYKYYNGKKLNLDNPKEFNEKIQWYKLYYHPKILKQLVDKYDVRAFVEDRIGSQYLNEIYGVYDKTENIPFDTLPNQFVIKATHTSGQNLIVTNKDSLNITKSRKLLKKWLKNTQYYVRSQEWAYKDLKPRLIVEKFLKDSGNTSLIDYKFYCFNGKVKFSEVHLDRVQNHKRAFYDLNFARLPYRYVSLKKSISSDVKKPSNFDEMINLSEVLAADLPFVRVDFYSIKGKSIFGEMTFYPSGGRKDFYPLEYNRIIGDLFELPKLKKEVN